MRTLKNRHTRNSPLAFIIAWLLVTFISMLLTLSLKAQDYSTLNKRANKNYYRKQTSLYLHACNLLDKKRHKKPRKLNIAKSYRANSKSVLSIDPSTVTAKAGDVQPQVKPVTKPLADQTADRTNQCGKTYSTAREEDVVLENNNLPKPTSHQHEEVRKLIADKLASKKDIFPLILPPLYFTFDEDEFSIVDMEPFLIAAEYALQGRTVLIEGHTDNQGKDSYNVKLSIKRVQKIRQLMLDMGVPDDRISVVGYGEELNKTNNDTEAGRQLNRRVDFTVF
jgi:outer membrane protein OmpA-like peptidoglycan-associated protein